MPKKSLLDKVPRVRLRPPQPTPKEEKAWESFLSLAEEFQQADGTLAPIVHQELERLAAKGNPLAIRLKTRIDESGFRPRTAAEAPLEPPAPRRITGLRWGKPGPNDRPGKKP